ncbi:MAG: hypothetical protein ACJ8GN_04600 [Longimicrobiaceae bacterium]
MAAEAGDSSVPFDRIAEALRLLDTVDPVRFRRIRRYLGPILVLERNDAAQLPDLRACMPGLDLVLSSPCSRLAATLVHESTHARIRAAGVPMRLDTIAREEILCTLEAIRFLERTPGGRAEADRMRQLLQDELGKDRPWFYSVLR